MWHTSPQAKYVELIHSTSNLYPNWHPAINIKLGDYGNINSDLSFSVEGNIFDDGTAERLGITPLTSNDTSCSWHLILSKAHEVHAHAEAEVGHGAFKAGFQKSFKMTDSHSAILAMHEPQVQYLDNPARLEELLMHDSTWSERIVVKEVYRCDAYGRIYAPEREAELELGLHADPMKAQGALKWQVRTASGDWDCSPVKEGAEALYVPLVRLVGKYHHRPHFDYHPYTQIHEHRVREMITQFGHALKGIGHT